MFSWNILIIFNQNIGARLNIPWLLLMFKFDASLWKTEIGIQTDSFYYLAHRIKTYGAPTTIRALIP